MQTVYSIDCTVTPVPDNSYLQIAYQTELVVSHVQLQVLDSGGMGPVFHGVVLATGQAGQEQDVCIGTTIVGAPVSVFIQKGERLSVKSLDGAPIATGHVLLSLLQW